MNPPPTCTFVYGAGSASSHVCGLSESAHGDDMHGFVAGADEPRTAVTDLADRLWVQHESGQVLDGSEVMLADEPVTRLADVIAQWRERFSRAAGLGEPRMIGDGNAAVVEYWRARALKAETMRPAREVETKLAELKVRLGKTTARSAIVALTPTIDALEWVLRVEPQ